MSGPGLPVPAYASRRERREAERAAEAVLEAESIAPIPAVEHVAVAAIEILTPQPTEVVAALPSDERDELLPEPTRASRRAERSGRKQPKPADVELTRGRRRRTFARSTLSGTAMLSVVGLSIGLSLPATATFGDAASIESAAALLSAPMPAAAPAAQGAPQAVKLEDAPRASMHLGGAIADARAEMTFASESKAEIMRARYLAAGRPFEPGFIPTTGSVRWPYPNSVEISSGFGDRDIGFHGGTDFVPGYGVPAGAIADGVVTWVGRDRTNFGYYVTIAHVIDGVRVDSLYAHLVDDSAEPYGLYPGFEIKVGEPIGDTGNTGFSTGPHLHLEIRLDGVHVNPFEWLTVNAR